MITLKPMDEIARRVGGMDQLSILKLVASVGPMRGTSEPTEMAELRTLAIARMRIQMFSKPRGHVAI